MHYEFKIVSCGIGGSFFFRIDINDFSVGDENNVAVCICSVYLRTEITIKFQSSVVRMSIIVLLADTEHSVNRRDSVYKRAGA